MFLLAGPALAQAGDRPWVLVLGDSLSAAYGMATQEGWVHLLEERLARREGAPRVLNLSISGETTSGGRARLPQALEGRRVAVCILELGANDGLRGLSLAQMEANLTALVDTCRQAGARVLLLGMRLPPNYGRTYTERFAAVYRRVAEGRQVALVPFLLDGVVQHREWMQDDGLHPRAAGQPRLLENVWAALEPLLEGDMSAAPQSPSNPYLKDPSPVAE
jgi:acyl-CoA thioesterase-1